MEIKINKLRLHNFKGTRDAEYAFACGNARIEGPNGSGKSTVFDAFTWLLFGKDHKGQSDQNFELKTIDRETGKPTPREEHWVEAELVVDGRNITLKRVLKENWVKPTGQTEEVFRGHTTTFLVDGVDVGTKKAYDAVIDGWMDEDMFKMLTNPHYFIDENYTPWKNRRKAIMDLVKDAPERVKVQEEFADVIEALYGRTVEEYRKRLTSERNANKRDLELTNNKIAGIKAVLPEEVSEAQIKVDMEALKVAHDAKVSELKDKIHRIDRAITGEDGTDEKRKAENDAAWAEITRVQLQMANMVKEARAEAQERNVGHEKALFEAKAYLSTAQSKAGTAKMSRDSMQEDLAELNRRHGEAANNLKQLGVSYDEVRARAFEYTDQTTCPYCGQEIPAASIEEAREKARQHFIEERKKAMEDIVNSAEKVKADAKAIDSQMDELKLRIEAAHDEYTKALSDANKWSAEVERLTAEPLVDLAEVERAERDKPAFRALAKEEQELRIKASNTAANPDGKEELMQEKAELERAISAAGTELTLALQPMQEALARSGVRKDQLAAITKLEQEAKCFADAIAKAERQEARAAEYVKAEINCVEQAIDGLFHVARWKMFDTTLDGGIVEMCEVTSPDGVPYKSMNDAMKILCGMDVIRVFSEKYGRRAPIFIDNAEGVLCKDFQTPAQVIRLVVADIPAITTTKE